MSDTKKRLDALNSRISADWDKMGFAPKQALPKQKVADPRAKYVGNNRDIFRGANSPLASTGPEPRVNRATTPREPAPKAAPRVEAPRGTSLAEQYSQGYRSPPGFKAEPPPKPKLRPEKPLPAKVKTAKAAAKPKAAGKSETRIAFEKRYARAKANKERTFVFQGKKYSVS